ncbi:MULTISPECIES: hypothetical protein [unclassified Variovorax]|uniref:hypothetical protein n=1 Tax=unclassified Variovorax TaxID=663243 RepID=UPI001BD269B9|nr:MULTISPECIES: hypothetical protein [unclassified Variovorax]
MKPHLLRWRAGCRLAAALWCAAVALPAHAQFALAISPPRFELEAEAGDRVRDTIELTHTAAGSGSYTVRTADWRMKPDGSVEFSDALAPGSCRPWVAIERRELSIGQGRPYRFRFEVVPPPDTPPVECRFALMVEGKDDASAAGMPLTFSGRIAVIVYVAVGKVSPVIDVTGSGVRQVDGQALPYLRVRNTGNAHGRLAGYLAGTDASDARLEFQPEALAILPGDTRDVALVPSKPGDADAAVAVAFPLTIQGKVEWGRSGTTAIDKRFAR